MVKIHIPVEEGEVAQDEGVLNAPDLKGVFEVVADDLSNVRETISHEIDSLTFSQVPHQFDEMLNFLKAFKSTETAPLSPEALRCELIAHWRMRLIDYRRKIKEDMSFYEVNSDMEEACALFLDREPTQEEFSRFLFELCIGKEATPFLLERKDCAFMVNLCLVYATRFVGRIAALPDKLRLAFARYDSGFKAPYIGAHYFPRTVFLRTDIRGSMERQSDLGEDTVRANLEDFANRVTEVEYYNPSIIPVKYAGDEVQHRVDDLTLARAFLAGLQGDMYRYGKVGLEIGGKEGEVIMVITPDNRVYYVGEGVSVSEKRQKGGKAIDRSFLDDGVLDFSCPENVVGATLEDVNGRTLPIDDQFFSIMMDERRGSVGDKTFQMSSTAILGTLHGTLLGEETSEGMIAMERLFYPSIEDSFSRYRIPGVRIDPSDINDPIVVERLMNGLAMTANRLYDLTVEHPTHVKAAFLGVSFSPFKYPVGMAATPEAICAYGEAGNAFMGRVVELCESYGVKVVYEDGEKGFLILGSGIYGSDALNMEENLAYLSRALSAEFPDRIKFFSQTVGDVVQGPVGGDINVSGEPIGYLARLIEKLSYFRSDCEWKDSRHLPVEFSGAREGAQFVLDEATYRLLLKRGFQISLVARKCEGVRGLKGTRRFYYVSEIILDRRSPQIPYGYDDYFNEMRTILSNVLGIAKDKLNREVTSSPQIRQVDLVSDPDVGAVEDFRAALADQARLDGYVVLGQHVIPQLSKVYGLIHYLLKELFQGNGERFSSFLDAHSVKDADMLILFYRALTGENVSVDLRQYRELVIEGMVRVLKLYSCEVKPICLFVHDLDSVDAESRRILQALMADGTGEGGGILVVTTQEVDSRAMTISREMHVAELFLDSEDMVSTGPMPVFPVDTIELIGISPERGRLIVAGLLDIDIGKFPSELDEFFEKVMGHKEAWSPAFIRPWVEYLLEQGFIERGVPILRRSLDEAYSSGTDVTQRMVQLRYNRLPEQSLVRRLFELASFLGESASEDLVLKCLERTTTTDLDLVAFKQAKLFVAEQGLMVFDGDQYRFPQSYISAAGRRIVGFDRRARNVRREYVLGVLLNVSKQGDFVPSDLLFDLSRELGVPHRIGPAIRDVVKAGAAYDPVNTDQLAKRFLSRKFLPFSKFSEEEMVAYMEIFHEWIRVLCDLNRPKERLTEALQEASKCLDMMRKGRLTPEALGMLEMDYLDVKAHVAYWGKDNESLNDSIRAMISVLDAEQDRIYIGFHRGRLLYREADKCRRGIKAIEGEEEKRRLYEQAVLLSVEADEMFSTVQSQISELPSSVKVDALHIEVLKMSLMVKGLRFIELPFLRKGDGFGNLTMDDALAAKGFMSEIEDILFSDLDLTPLHRVSLFYLLGEGASMSHDFKSYVPLFKRELSQLRDAGHVRAYVEMQLNLFLMVGEEAQYQKTLSALDLFKSEIEAMFLLKPFLKASGLLVVFYTNVIEYWNMRLDLANSSKEASECLENARKIWALIHDPNECDYDKVVGYFHGFVENKRKMLMAMEQKCFQRFSFRPANQ